MTIFQLDEGLDSGPGGAQRAEPILPDDTRGTLARAALRARGDAADRGARPGGGGRARAAEQPEEGVTYAEKIDPAERRLDPARPAAELERIVRALTPGIGAYLELEGGERLGVEAARGRRRRCRPREVVADDGRLLVGCADGALELLRVQARRRTVDGGRRLPARALAAARVAA